MKKKYEDIRRNHQNAINELDMIVIFANSADEYKEKLKQELEKRQLPSDTPMVRVGSGILFTKEMYDKFKKISQDCKKTIQEQMELDTTGEGFISEAFAYELLNTEYVYSDDITPALDGLYLNESDLHNGDPKFAHAMEIAIRKALDVVC